MPQTTLGGGFASGDLMLSTNTSAPSGWSDVSATYDNKFMRISSGTPLTVGGSDAHTHDVGSYASADHIHTLDSVNVSGPDSSPDHYVRATSDGKIAAYGGSVGPQDILKHTTISGGGAAIEGTSAGASDVPAYIQLRLFKKN